MKVPADLSADRLIREYLARVAEVGMHHLPMGRRGAFVEGTRRRIEREIGPDGIRDAARVRDVLSRLGDPADLVRAESARLDAERTKRQPGNKGVGEADPAGATAPLAVRPINSRWRPGTRWQPSAGQGDTGPQTGRPASEARRGRGSAKAGWEGCCSTGRAGGVPSRESSHHCRGIVLTCCHRRPGTGRSGRSGTRYGRSGTGRRGRSGTAWHSRPAAGRSGRPGPSMVPWASDGCGSPGV
jgi:hypothetical protein